MNVYEGIKLRRSIRKYTKKRVPRELVEKILEAAVFAPSGNNNQPWWFIVVEGDPKKELVALLSNVDQDYKSRGLDTKYFRRSIKVIDEAPVLILAFNTEYDDSCTGKEGFNHYRWLTDIQSIAAAIQNMLLVAQELGLGSLWICDIVKNAEKLICAWLNCQYQLVAAVAIGYAGQSPIQRSRKPWQEVTEWIGL